MSAADTADEVEENTLKLSHPRVINSFSLRRRGYRDARKAMFISIAKRSDSLAQKSERGHGNGWKSWKRRA